jgi:Cd2+/Zn2+-exporting ATPase
MLGRFGETHETHGELLDKRQIAAMTLSLVALAVGIALEFAVGTRKLIYNPFYGLGLILLGGPIVWNALKGVFTGHTNVDELVALALIASAAGGFFLEADVVAILMVGGSMFEQRASLRARKAIEQLLRLAPAEAVVFHDDGSEETIPAENLRTAMRVIIRSGQRVPADGIIENGAAHVDQSAVTGESVPVYRQVGETVWAGSLTLDSAITIRVTRAGEDSTVGQIIKIVQEAEQYQAPAMRIADQWAKYYTPLILAVAALTLGIFWLLHHGATGAFAAAWQRAVAVLVVGCPCTIVLATPTAVIAAMGRSARLGLLIKHGAVLEKAAKVDTLIFDKTGTLTSGHHQVVAVVPAEDLKGLDEVIGLCPAIDHSILKLQMSEEEHGQLNTVGHATPQDAKGKLLALAASVEHASNHPFARAIRDHAADLGMDIIPATDIREIAGVGVQGRISGQRVIVARPEYIAKSIRNACAVPGTMIRPIRRYSVIAVEVAGVYAGLILLRDAMRPTAEAVVEELRETGLTNLSVLSGDHKGAVKLVADQLKLDQAYSGLLPADKAGQVKALKEQGHLVAFVGDGINDAPALATADVAIAMGGTGTDIALETADVILLNDRIELLATFFALSRKVRKTIYGNLIFGLALNVAALVLASSGILSPMMGALVHNLGSAFVVGNSARLAAFGKVQRDSEELTQISGAKRVAA